MQIIVKVIVIMSVLAVYPLHSRTVGPAAVSKAVEKPVVTPPLQPERKVPVVDVSKDTILKQLDTLLLQASIDDVWYDAVDNLIFDLYFIDRGMAKDYLKRIHIKNTQIAAAKIPSVTPVPSPTVDVRRGTSPTPPPPPVGKKVIPPSPGGIPTPTPPPGQKGMGPTPPPVGKKGTGPTPPPPPGPMVKKDKQEGPLVKAPIIPAAPQGPEPLSIRGTYSAARLAKETDADLIELFNDLLAALPTSADFWNAKDKKPQLDWENKIGAVKKALLDPKRSTNIDADKRIEDRIKEVRTEKAQQGQKQQAAAEQAKEKEERKEEVSEAELVVLIETLLKQPNVSDFKWLVKFTTNVKKLDAINHDMAVEYESNFIKKFPEQKPFLPKKKEVVAKKELTEEEQKMEIIDKILNEKPFMWAIKVREHVQALYDMSPVLGLKYQEKVLAATKEATGKADRPFLKMAE